MPTSTDIKIFGREPAVWTALFAVAVQFVSAFWIQVSPDVQTGVNVVMGLTIGLYVAWRVHDGTIAALTGLAQALLALGMNLGLDWSTNRQTAFMALITLTAQAFVRTQVTAPVPAAAPKALGPGA